MSSTDNTNREDSRKLCVVRLAEDGRSVVILDQTRLPGHEEYLTIADELAAWRAINRLEVRGAPAIGVFAAYAMYVLARQYEELPYEDFLARFQKQSDYLNSSRPTAVNLSWALKRQNRIVEENGTSRRQRWCVCWGKRQGKLTRKMWRCPAESENSARRSLRTGTAF